jgi:hypothetical protein
MSIIRALAAVALLLVAVAFWWMASAQAPRALPVLSAEMAPAAIPHGGEAWPPSGGLHWQPLDQRVLADWRGPYWLRWRLATAKATDPVELALQLSLRAASKIYWNGQLLADNGRVADAAADELPGKIDFIRALPRSASNDVNELIVLASSHYQLLRLHNAGASVVVAPLEPLLAQRTRPWLVAAFAIGVLAAAWLYFLSLQWQQKPKAEAMLLLALGAVGLALPAVELWRPLFGYAYPWHGPRLLALLVLHLLAALLLPCYLARRFSVTVPRVAWLMFLVMLAAVVALLPSFDGRGTVVLLLSMLACTVLLLRARSEPGERWPLLALIATAMLVMLLDSTRFLDGPYFLLLSVLMGFLLVRHGAHLQELDRQNLWLREERARLSLQLLQRGIQPHWLMNTLTSLQELIEQAPSRASRLVELLAEQFDRLCECSKNSLVTLDQELALCRNHLDIVSQAVHLPIALEVDAADTGLLLPPGVLHVQVENALTHAGAVACAQRPFRLCVSHQQRCWILLLRSAKGSAKRNGHGTGYRYIEESLAACYPGHWSFRQYADGADWCVRIEVTCAS